MAFEVRDLFDRARQALRVSQVGLALSLGASRRTGQRWDAGQSYPSASQLATLARAVYPQDPELAAEIATSVGTTVDALGLVPSRADGPIQNIVDSVVCAAADAMDVLPRAVRPALIAAFARARELRLGIEDVEKGLTAKTVPQRAKGEPGPKRPV